MVVMKTVCVNGKIFMGVHGPQGEGCIGICYFSDKCFDRAARRKIFNGKSCKDLIGTRDTYFVPVEDEGGL